MSSYLVLDLKIFDNRIDRKIFDLLQSTKRRYVHSENSYVFTAVDDVEVKVEAEMKEHRMNQSISTKEQFQLLKCSVRVRAHTYCMMQFEVHRHVIAMIHTYFTIQCCQYNNYVIIHCTYIPVLVYVNIVKTLLMHCHTEPWQQEKDIEKVFWN